ncbi:hypothetical protein [Lysobacter sp. HA35]
MRAEDAGTIRAALKDEKQEQKANGAIRAFVNPAGQGSVATLVRIWADQPPRSENLNDFGSVIVPAGSYHVAAKCYLFPFTMTRETVVLVEPGVQYRAECVGQTAHNTELVIYRLPG